MNEYVLFFRIDIHTEEIQPSAEQMEEYMIQWQHWLENIESQGKLSEGGNHLSKEGRVVNSNKEVMNEPYTHNKLSIPGYILILANDFDDAVEIAKACPILNGEGNSVEIRQVS